MDDKIPETVENYDVYYRFMQPFAVLNDCKLTFVKDSIMTVFCRVV
jgi:hypothetical protein